MSVIGTRPNNHAGSWYHSDSDTLSNQLSKWLKDVSTDYARIPGARAIIAPHAGYSYSGPCAAWAYKALDLSRARRVFLLGPSHTFYLNGCALTTFEKYATPFGDFQVDVDVLTQLKASGEFTDIPRENDVREHSLEMQLPFLWQSWEETPNKSVLQPTIVPIMVGDGDAEAEKGYGKLLLPYFKDLDNVFVISSDFCHWGLNFDFVHYCPSTDFAHIRSLSLFRDRPEHSEPPIHIFIRDIDKAAFASIEAGSQALFLEHLRITRNTICGRHPISVTMAALEILGSKDASAIPKFKFIQYKRSSLVKTVSDSSVSYGSAFAIF